MQNGCCKCCCRDLEEINGLHFDDALWADIACQPLRIFQNHKFEDNSEADLSKRFRYAIFDELEHRHMKVMIPRPGFLIKMCLCLMDMQIQKAEHKFNMVNSITCRICGLNLNSQRALDCHQASAAVHKTSQLLQPSGFIQSISCICWKQLC